MQINCNDAEFIPAHPGYKVGFPEMSAQDGFAACKLNSKKLILIEDDCDVGVFSEKFIHLFVGLPKLAEEVDGRVFILNLVNHRAGKNR